MNSLKYKLTALIFLFLIVVIGGLTLYGNFDSIKTLDRNVIDQVYTTDIKYFDRFINIWSAVQRMLGVQLFDDVSYGVIIKDNHGKLHFPAAEFDTSVPLSETIAFSKLLKKKGIPFVYIQAPNKKLKDYTVFPKGGYNYSNEDADKYISGLTAEGVNVLDLRKSIISQNLDRKTLFYATDHHWTTGAAFWAFGEVVEYLHLNYLNYLNLDSNNFYRDIKNYTQTEYKNSFLGSLGRRIGKYAAGVDDYTLISPKFTTDYMIFDAIQSTEDPISSGSFNESIVKQAMLDTSDITLNKHACYFEYDYGNLIIKNNLADNNIKLLLIKDSFSLPLAAFLSTCVSELHMIDLRDPSAPLPADYVNLYDFDTVILLYNTEVFGSPEMFKFS